MATLVLGAVGALVGSAFGGPAGAKLGFSIGAVLGGVADSYLFPPAALGKLSDLRVTSSSYGTDIPTVWGAMRVPGTVIWSTILKEHDVSVHTGGGSGGGGQKQATYTVSLAVALCMGGRMTSSSLLRIHANDEVVYDSRVAHNKVTVRFYTGSETQTADPLLTAALGSNTPAYRGLCYMMLQDFPLVDFGNSIPNISVELTTPTVYVSDVITDLALKVGLQASDLDVTAVSAMPVEGWIMPSRMSAKDAMLGLLSWKQIDLIDVDGILRAVPRGGTTVATITRDQQGAAILGSGVPAPVSRLSKTRMQDTELPRRVDVAYYDLNNSYQQGSQGAVKQSALSSNNLVSISVPAAMTGNEAKTLADQQLFQAWVERDKYTTALLPTWRWLVPSDPVLLETDAVGTLTRCRMIECEEGFFGELRVTFVSDNSDLPIGANMATSGSRLNTPFVPSIVPTVFFAWSGVEARNSDQAQPGFYVAATGDNGWNGCQIYYSTDGGSTYSLAGTASQRSVFGATTNSLGSSYVANGNGFDATNTFDVALVGGAGLTSTSESSVQTGAGNYGVLVKTDTSVSNAADDEIVGFAAATLQSDGSYVVSDLLRAQRGTLATGHTTGDTFVQLDSSIVRVPVATNLIGHTVLVKCVSPYEALADVDPQTVYISQPTVSMVQGEINALQGTEATHTTQITALNTAYGQIVGTPGPAWGMQGNDANIGGGGAFNPSDIVPSWSDFWHSKDGNIDLGAGAGLGSFEPVVFQMEAILYTRLYTATAKTIQIKVQADNACRVFLQTPGGTLTQVGADTNASTGESTYSLVLGVGNNNLVLCFQNSDLNTSVLKVQGWTGSAYTGLSGLVDNMYGYLPPSGVSSWSQLETTATATVPDGTHAVVTTQSAGITLTLSTITSTSVPLDVINKGTGSVTVTRGGTNLIDGATTLSVGAGNMARLIPARSTGNWYTEHIA